MPPFDLTTQPWIPVRYGANTDGPSEIGLIELFTRAREIADIALPVPPAASGLWRVLYLIAARVTGLDAVRDWRPWTRDRREILAAGEFDPGKVSRYFAGHAGRLDLFHPDRPWLQDPRLAAECPKSTGINKLVMGRASGNNLVWLSHHTDLAPRPVRAAEAAWYLLAWLYYGPSGKITARTVRGRTESNMTAGPLRSRISFHPLGRNLFASLVAGIPFPAPDSSSGRPDPDLAPWEDDDLPDPLGRPPARKGLSGPLTGQFRHAVLLTPSPDGAQVTDARVTWAWRMPAAEIADPYMIYDTSKEDGMPYARYARFDRAIWRDLDALLLQDTGSGRTRRPAVFSRLPDESLTGALRVRAYGFDQEGQAADRQWFTASTPKVLVAHETEDGDELLYEDSYEISAAREAAERVGDDLRTALRRAWAALGDPGGKGKIRSGEPEPPWLAGALGRYWRDAESTFWQMVQHQRPFEYLSNTFIRIAIAAYDEVTDKYAARRTGVVVRALERARGGIFATWSPVQPDPPEADDA